VSSHTSERLEAILSKTPSNLLGSLIRRFGSHRPASQHARPAPAPTLHNSSSPEGRSAAMSTTPAETVISMTRSELESLIRSVIREELFLLI
jgi:hypothetical protein